MGSVKDVPPRPMTVTSVIVFFRLFTMLIPQSNWITSTASKPYLKAEFTTP